MTRFLTVPRWIGVAALIVAMAFAGLLAPPANAEGGSARASLDDAELTPAAVESVQSLERPGAAEDLGRGDEPRVYLIELQDPAVPSYRGGKDGLAATSTNGESQLDRESQAVREYEAHLEATQEDFANRMDRAAGRDVEVAYTYQYAVNGLAATMTPDEARRVAQDPEVARISLDKERILQTDNGPAWFGADDVWGENPPVGNEPCVGACGEGIVIGTIDTGISPANPSFADVGDDGYDHENPFGAGNYFGVCDPANTEQYDPDFVCNDKLIGAYGFLDPGAPGNALDYDGHGSHTASTSGGNVLNNISVDTPSGLTTPPVTISGVAPHANIIAYTGCCSLSGLTASIDQAIADGVDVINYSIGSSSPSALWDDFDSVGYLNARAAGISVVTSNGNAGPLLTTTGSPADAPWITSVGASTHNRHNGSSLTNLTSSNGNLPDIAGKATAAGIGSLPIVHAVDYGNELCIEGGWNAGTDLTGLIVICDRGVSGRVSKSQAVADAGGSGFVLINDELNGGSLLGDEYVVPGLFISYVDGQALKAWLDNGASDHTAAISGTVIEIGDEYGDVLASFSSRGPNQAVDVIVPDVTAPGVDILAALGDGASESPVNYNDVVHGFISGTSMSSPHVAGASALIRQVRPDWTPAEVQSALMTTATPTVLTHEGNVANPYEQGAGRAQVDRAVDAGLLFDESIANYEAANPDEGGDPKAINIPSFANSQCLAMCEWTRTANVPVGTGLPTGVTWTASTVSDDGLVVDVDLSPATVSPGDTMTVTVTADVSGAVSGENHFSRITLTPSDASIPAVTMPLAVVPSDSILPGAVELTTRRDAGSWPVEGLQGLEITDFTGSVSGLVEADTTEMTLSPDPTNGDPYDNIGDGTVEVIWVEVAEGSRRLLAEIVESVPQDLDLFVGFDADGELDVDADEEVAFSASGTALESVAIENPEAGSWWVLVQHWDGDVGPALVDTAVVPGDDLGNAHVEGPETNPLAEPFDVRVFWDLDDAAPGNRFHGVMDLGTSAATPDNIGSIPVTIVRIEDDVAKTADVDTAVPGDTVTYTIEVQPNLTPEDLEYEIVDTIPDGMTYVPNSLTGPDMSFDDVSYRNGVITWTPTVESSLGASGSYNITTSTTDPSCVSPLGGYFDLRTVSPTPILPNAGITGDTSVWTVGGGAPIDFLGQGYPSLGFTDDGFLVFDSASNYGGQAWIPQSLPDPDLPNNLLAMLWDDYEIVYDPAADDAGVSIANLNQDGPGSALLVDYRHLPPWFGDDPAGPDFTEAITLQVLVWRTAVDGSGNHEIYVTFDELNSLTNPVTTGWENAGGTAGGTLFDAEPATGLTTDTVICFDMVPGAGVPMAISYEATVDPDVADTHLTNIVDHVTDNPGAQHALTADTVTVGTAAPTTVTVEATGTPATTTTPGEFTITRDDPAFDIVVDYEVTGTGTPGTDYRPLTGSVVLEAGETTATVDVDVMATPTASRTVVMDLLPGADYEVGDPSSATVTITGRSAGGGGGGTPGGVPAVSVAAADDTFVFSHSGGSSLGALTVAYSVGGTAIPGEDYTALSGTATIPAGTDIVSVPVDFAEDATDGATVEVTVIDGDAYDVGTSPTATLVASGVEPPPGPAPDGIVLAGETRIETAIAVSMDAFPEDDSADAVVLTRADVPFDALSATPLAVRRNGPLLLTQQESMHPATMAEIDRVLPDGGTVYLMGGTAAQSEDVELALTAAGYEVDRLAGPTRFETGLAVAEEIGDPEVVLIASGERFPDALSAGAAAGSVDGLVLITPDGVAHPGVTDYLAARPDTPTYAIGGPAAAAFPGATPIVGSGREATAVMVAEEFFDGPARIGLARGDDFADALAGGVHSALNGGPVTLTPSTELASVVQDYICANADTLEQGYVYGGDAAVNPSVVTDFVAAVNGEGCPA